MQKVFENTDIKIINDFINSVDEDSTIILNGDFYGTLYFENKNNISINIIGEGTRLLGTNKLTVGCQKYDKNIYKVKLDKDLNIERAWINGRSYIMARYPDSNLSDDKYQYTTMEDALKRIKADGNCDNAYVRALHTNEWGGNSYKVSNANSNSVKLNWVGNNNRGSGALDNCVILENLFKELNYQNEFYYNNKTGEFFFYNVGDIQRLTLEYSVNQTVLEIKNCNANISLNNIGFYRTDNSMFKGKWERYLRSDWAFNNESAVKIINSSNVNFKSCIFNDLGNTAVQILNNCSNISFYNCDFTDLYSNGILIRGDKSSTYCTSCWDKNNHKTRMESPDKIGAKNELYPKDIIIKNCLFENIGIVDLQCAGVCISLAKGVTVKNSTFCYMPRAGINICENAFGGHKIIGNDIFECVRQTGDHGPFNSWGRDRFWSLKKFNTTGKYGKIKKPYAFYDMLERNEIAYNRVVGKRGFGIDLDDGSSGYNIHHNLCIGVGIKLREGFERIVDNNVIINAPIDYHCAFYKNDDIIKNNIVFNDIPICEVLTNKGSNTKFKNNYHIWNESSNDSRFYFDNSLYVKSVLNGKYNFNGIQKLNNNYGRDCAFKPSLVLKKSSQVSKELKGRFYILKTIDESIRTTTGAPNYRGLFVKKCNSLSWLYKIGVRTGDVIYKADEKDVNSNNFKELLSKSKTIIVIRNQREFILRK